MNDGFVADSSLGIAWVTQSQSTPATDSILRDVASGRTFVVPVLWPFEVANTLLSLLRRGRINPADCNLAQHTLVRLRPIVDDEGPAFAISKILQLAQDYILSVYDATYLELALRRNLPLASRDAALNKAAKRSGVKILLD